MSKFDFVGETKKILSGYEENKLAPLGFEIDNSDNGGECVLVMGLNPAGNEKDAKNDIVRKNNNLPYFYYLGENKKEIEGFTHLLYHGAIHKFIEEIMRFNDETAGVKWPWCNIYKDIQSLPEELKRDISEYYEIHKNNQTTIYIGDMFYYHQKRSTEFKKLLNEENCPEYCKKILKMHIDCLKEHNKKIKFIYIANATVSHWLNDKDNIKTNETIEGIPVFYGGMLSGIRAMDLFSRKRIINEIQSVIFKSAKS